MGMGPDTCSKQRKRNIDGGVGSYCSNSNDSGGGAQVHSTAAIATTESVLRGVFHCR